MKKFTFTVWYFKDTGKFYTSATFELECDALGEHQTPYMYAAVDHIRQWRDRRTPLPGLCCSWDGPILVNHPDGYPCLILGRE